MDALETGIEWHKTLQKINLPPIATFHKAGIRCSMWLPVLVGLFTGWVAGLLGIGGGLIQMPALVYLIGCPTHVAVGTDLFNVALSGLYGAASYSYKGRVELYGGADHARGRGGGRADRHGGHQVRQGLRHSDLLRHSGGRAAGLRFS